VPITQENLENMADNNLCFGFFGGYYIGNTDQDHAWRCKYSLNKLVELLGAKDDLSDIEKKLGFEINLPPFIGGRKVIQTDRGILSDRHIHYLWVLKRIIELCPDRDSAIIEIGAGLGLLGYFLDKAGYKDYTNIDLAYPQLAQTYFLYRNLPEREFILSGEVENPFSADYKNALKLLHSSEFKNIKDRFDIMINMDSLPEMKIDEATKYISSEVPLLLSINRENYNFRVADVAPKYRELIYRRPFVLRNDSEYFEELYKK
jgi:hypothetical protein